MASHHTELYCVVFIALAVLVFYGSGNEGKASFFDTWVEGYVEEKALAFDVPHRVSSSQMTDVNSLFAGVGGADVSPVPSTDVTTIGASALLALTPPDSDYIERFSGKGMRAGVIEYTVQEGDLLSFIASDYGVTQQSIIWANGLKDADSLSLGQVLRIPPITGVVHKAVSGDTALSLAKKYSADGERIISYNRLPKDGSLQVGDEIIIPDGRIAQQKSIANIPASSVQAAKQFTHLPDLGGYFMNPTTGTLSRGGAIHGRNGIDIANSYGTAIYAAADGVVSIADPVGYNGGYGQYIKIIHPNGTETLYGHASKLLVSAGQSVSKGMKIALMGSTGRSTGNHLHFEVHGAKNPLVRK